VWGNPPGAYIAGIRRVPAGLSGNDARDSPPAIPAADPAVDDDY
jgi:hypothetical protein